MAQGRHFSLHGADGPGQAGLSPCAARRARGGDGHPLLGHALRDLGEGRRGRHERVPVEHRCHQRGPGLVLRSKMPDGVIQEVYGYLCVHYAIRWLMHSAATDYGHDPDRLSFRILYRSSSQANWRRERLESDPIRVGSSISISWRPVRQRCRAPLRTRRPV